MSRRRKRGRMSWIGRRRRGGRKRKNGHLSGRVGRRREKRKGCRRLKGGG